MRLIRNILLAFELESSYKLVVYVNQDSRCPYHKLSTISPLLRAAYYFRPLTLPDQSVHGQIDHA